MEDSLGKDEFEFCLNIIHSINDDGYLDGPFEDLIAETELERERCFDLLGVIQRFDPVGCGAQDLVDCLLAQARIAEERSPLLEKIIRNHLPDLKNRDHEKIAKTLGVSTEQIHKTAELLKNFHPKPGRLVGGNDTHYVVPDIYVVQMGANLSSRLTTMVFRGCASPNSIRKC